MVDMTILAMTEDQVWLESLWSEARRLKRTRLVVTSSMDEACDLLDCAGARLLVLDRGAGTFTYDELDRMLWTNSTCAHPALVLVIDQTYSPEVALDLFRMGVDEYVCTSLHGNRLAEVVSELLKEARDGELEAVPALLALPRTVPAPLQIPDRPAVAAMA